MATSETAARQPFAHAIIALANDYQFSKGERLSQPKVKSRMLLWGKAGKGTLRVNGEDCPIAVDDFAFLPWDRSMTYQADRDEPFFIGAIHIIPFHDRNRKMTYDVSHREDDAMANCAWRRDVKLSGLEGIQRGALNQSSALRHLAEAAVQRFLSASRTEWEMHSLAQLLLATLSDFFHRSRPVESAMPAELQTMVQFVRNHFHQKLSLEHIAEFAKRSPSAVGRLFRKHLGVTPVEFITRAKMELAQQLLSTSRLPVGEVGRRVGIDDPYYFSKLFRKTVGCTPLEHRKKSSLL